MARNKSEEVHKLKTRILFLEARLGDMSKEATNGRRDTMAMMELVEEAREEAYDWRYKWARGQTTDHVEVSHLILRNQTPWEEAEAESRGATGARGPRSRSAGATGATGAAWPTGATGATGFSGSNNE